MLYRYKVPGTTDRTVFSLGVGRTVVDSVQVLTGVQIAIDREPDRYTVRAAIPLVSYLHFKPEAGKSYRGDFGVIHSDQAGQTNVLRDVLV